MMKDNISTVTLGKLNTVPVLVPVEHKASHMCINSPVTVDGECYYVTAVSVNSAHGVVIVDDLSKVDVDSLGSKLGTHPLFPNGANIVFVQILDGKNIKARLWQKGVGETDYTPEAVCVAAAAFMMQSERLMSSVNVEMNGNYFSVDYDRASGDVSLSGEAGLIGA